MEYSHGKSFQILNDFDKCREPQELCSELIQKKTLTTYIKGKKEKRLKSTQQKKKPTESKQIFFFLLLLMPSLLVMYYTYAFSFFGLYVSSQAKIVTVVKLLNVIPDSLIKWVT